MSRLAAAPDDHRVAPGDGPGDGPGDALLEVQGLTKDFPVGGGILGRRRGVVRAVDGVDLSIRRGETLALVGESGCGKSTLGRCIVQLHRPDTGRVLFEGRDLSTLRAAELRRARRRLQIVFQDPNSSLTPRMTVGRIVEEPLRVHKLVRGSAARRRRVHELLDMVGLLPSMAARYPHEFSGGQRQRVAIARALAHEPTFVVCDEAVSALDVSIQAQILTLLKDLQRELGLTYLFITHDLAAARHQADRVAVMYLGHIVERASESQLFDAPAHPYTRALISVVPIPDPAAEARRERLVITGEPASPLHKPEGCVFHPRCPAAIDDCRLGMPELRHLGGDHHAACIRAAPVPDDHREDDR